jgi:hypothetical protein
VPGGQTGPPGQRLGSITAVKADGITTLEPVESASPVWHRVTIMADGGMSGGTTLWVSVLMVVPSAGLIRTRAQAVRPVVGTHSEPLAKTGTAADPPARSPALPTATDQRVAPVSRLNELSLPSDRAYADPASTSGSAADWPPSDPVQAGTSRLTLAAVISDSRSLNAVLDGPNPACNQHPQRYAQMTVSAVRSGGVSRVLLVAAGRLQVAHAPGGDGQRDQGDGR